MMMDKDLPYPAIIRPLSKEEGEGYVVEFPDLPGCFGDGDSPEEALREAESALHSWIVTAKEFGDPLPQPKKKYSGQWRLRIPKSLHAELVYRAKYENVSLNTLVTTILAGYMGHLHKHDKHFH
jgi:antitoxin HicB